jgi:hypothetical protein
LFRRSQILSFAAGTAFVPSLSRPADEEVDDPSVAKQEITVSASAST